MRVRVPAQGGPELGGASREPLQAKRGRASSSKVATPPPAKASTPSQWSNSNGSDDEEEEDVHMEEANEEDSSEYGDGGIDFSTVDLSGIP